MMAIRRTALAVAICLGIPLAVASPASAARGLTVTPHTDLTDNQIVSVSGAGFNRSVEIGVCQAIMSATPSRNDCGTAVDQLPTSPTGEFSLQSNMRQSINPMSLGRTVNCWVETCVMMAAELNDWTGTATFSTPLTFVHIQVDGQIRRLSDSKIIGDDIYNYAGTGQRVSHGISPGGDWSFAVQVQNDGDRTENVTVRARPAVSSSSIRVRYFAGWFDVTSYVLTGTGFTFANVPPGGIRRLPVQFRADAGAPLDARASRILECFVVDRPGIVSGADAVLVGVRVVAP